MPSRKKREIIRSKYKDVKKVDRSHEIWEVDLTYVHCGIDSQDRRFGTWFDRPGAMPKGMNIQDY
jgi:hypothetical protein